MLFDKSSQLTETSNNKKKKSSFLSRLNPFRAKVDEDELLTFTQDFAALTKEGMSIIHSLDMLASKTKNKYLRKIILEARLERSAGIPIHVCFRRYNKIFNSLYCDALKIGEETARTDQVLERLAYVIEQKTIIKEKVDETIAYPCRIFTMAIFEFLLLMSYVIPNFSKLYDGFYKPKITTIVMNIAFWFEANIYYILASIGILFVFFFLINLTKKGKLIIDYLKYNTPIFGELNKKYNLILYSRNLTSLYNSGINFIPSMRICNELIDNEYIKSSLNKAADSIENGQSITDAYCKTNIFPKKFINLIETGEETGYIDEIFTKIADDYNREIDLQTRQITTMVEPIYIAIMSVISGIIIVAMCLPLYYMITTLTNSK